jgi:hypothetical protein
VLVSGFKVLSWHVPGGTEKATIYPNQLSWAPGHDANAGPPGYKSGVNVRLDRQSFIPRPV